jgi:hypothetical protein
VAGKLGYLGYNRGFVFDVGSVGTPLAQQGVPVLNLRQQVPVEGVWAAAAVAGTGPRRGFSSCDPGDPFCLSLGFSWLFPNIKEGVEQYNLDQEDFPTAYRTWQTSIQWWTLEAAALRCSWSTFSLIGGLRYDSFSSKFSNPTLLPAISTSADEGDLTLSSYIPYVGGEAAWGAVKVGVIGFPWVFGTIAYKETSGPLRVEASGSYRNAYFVETFAEFGKQVGVAHLSAFATYTVLHAVGDFDATVNNFSVFPASAGSYAWGFDRQNWIVGGKLVVGLNTPL